MKNLAKWREMPSFIQKIVRVMKISVFLELICTLQLSASVIPAHLEYKIVDDYVLIAKKDPVVAEDVKQQKKELKGTVTDAEGNTLPGVSVVVKGTSTGVATDMEGKYSLEVSEGDVLVYSFIGMVSQEVTVGSQTVIDVVLESESVAMDEVVLVSFGKQKKKNVISSITTVKPAELKVSSSNLTTALAGKVSGLIAFQRGGEPGADNAKFFVRGVTTFNERGASSPLILIDGVELTANDLRRLHPDDIAAFSIMKDATATALYGARGANGVIFVTTKEGTEGPIKVSARIEASFSMPTQNVELADPITYMRLSNEAVRTRAQLGDFKLPYSYEKIDRTLAGTNPILYPAVDWQKELFKDYAVNKRFNFSLNGGGKVARYYVSVAGSQDNGILEVPKVNDFNNNIKFKQYNLRSNININLTKTSKLKLNFNANFENYNGPRQGGGAIYGMVMRSNPVRFRPFYEKDDEHKFTNHILFGNYGDGKYVNPYAEMVSGYKELVGSKVIAQLEFNQDFSFLTEGLSFKLIFNDTKESSYAIQRFNNPYYYEPSINEDTGLLKLTNLNPKTGTEYLDYEESGKTVTSSTYIESNFTYNKEIDDNNQVTGLLVFTLNNRLLSNQGTLEKSLPYRNMGLSGRFTYAYKQKYFVEANFGFNGSERFAKNERWGFFPAFGLGWMASDEEFFSPLKDVVTSLKFKGSYGIVGNDQIGGANDRFFYLSRVDLDVADGGYRTGENFTNSLPGVSIEQYGNNLITWETATKYNLGMELGLFNKLNLEVDVFKENRSNILYNRILSSSLGLQTNVRANIGEATSGGIDASLVYTQNFNKNAWLQVRGNFTYATNKITKIEEPDYSATPWLSRVGQPINQTWGFVAERLFIDQAEVDNSPEQTYGEYTGGDIKYKDINGDGKVSDLDKVPIGNPTVPEIVYGAGLSFGYKDFDISVFFQGAANSSFWIDPWKTAPFVDQNQLLKAYADSHWSEANRDIYALWPRLSKDDYIRNNYETSTWFMQDGAFLRMKSAELGYSLPEKMVSRLKMNKARFYVSGTNLFVLSKFKLWDPELAGNGLGYPNQRVFSFGVNISL